MGLVEEIAAAKASVAQAASEVQTHRDGLDQNRSADGFATAGGRLGDLEAREVAARVNLERVEREALERARAIVGERDPAYLEKVTAAKLVPAVEQSTLIGAADRLAG
jgi:hypothetical protein